MKPDPRPLNQIGQPALYKPISNWPGKWRIVQIEGRIYSADLPDPIISPDKLIKFMIDKSET